MRAYSGYCGQTLEGCDTSYSCCATSQYLARRSCVQLPCVVRKESEGEQSGGTGFSERLDPAEREAERRTWDFTNCRVLVQV